MKEAIVTILSAVLGETVLFPPDNSTGVLVCYISVMAEAESVATQIGLVDRGFSPDLRPSLERSYRTKMPHGRLVFVEDISDDTLIVRSPHAELKHNFSIAAAVTVWNKSWGWDESESNVIRVNGEDVQISAEYDGFQGKAVEIEPAKT